MINKSFLAHYGVKGMKWGVRRYQSYTTPEGLSKKMKSFTYDDSVHPLKSPTEVAQTKSGNCHDQVMYELSELRKSGKDPKAAFLIEADPKTNQGGATHSFVYYHDGAKTIWFENAWGGHEGIHEFSSFSEIKKDIEKRHKNGEFGNSNEYSKLYWGEFDDSVIHPGDSLQDIVDKCMRQDYLMHHGVKGMKWGVRRYQNYDGTRIKSGTVFVSGSSKTQTKDSPYYRKNLPKGITDSLDEHIKKKDKIVVGDAPGIDRQVQDYLKSKNYKNVEVYGPGKQVRYSADENWKTNPIDSDYEEGSKEWLAEKDKMMSQVATEGLAVVLPEGSKATRKNIDRLIEQNKKVNIFELNQNEKFDRSYTSDDYILGRERIKATSKTKPMVDDIIGTMSKDEKDRLGLHPDGEYLTTEDGASVAKRVLIKDGNTPVSFFDMFDDGDQYNVALGTRSGKNYRGKGYATKAAKRGMNYYEKHKDEFGNKPVVWGVRTDNEPSIKIAKSLGFELDESSYSDDDQWVNYVKKYK